MVTSTEFWDDIAEKYSRKPVANPAAYQRKLDITKARLSPTDVILDLGCGTGSLALELAPHVAHVHALDISAEMIRIGRGKAEAANIDNITFHTGTLDDSSSFEPEQLDGVCAYNILHLVPDRAGTMRRVCELTKPGGFYIGSTAVLGESWVPFGPVLKVMQWLGKAPPVYIFDKDTHLRELREAGYVDISTPDVGAKSDTAFVVAKKP